MRSDIDFEELLMIRFLHDFLIRLDCPRPRISKLYYYWDPVNRVERSI